MPALKGLEWTFDTVASTYEKLRPGYVEELYRKVFDYIPINENSNVVEVGSGGEFARFANHPFRDKGNPELCKKIDELYGKYYYTFHNKKQEIPKEYNEQQAIERALIAENTGLRI